MANANSYRGRFAPSPTGDLHFGSLLAALGSWLRARAANGRWLVRIEDLDPPREAPGSADSILRTLQACALEPDEPPLYQSARLDAYGTTLQRLRESGHAIWLLMAACTVERASRRPIRCAIPHGGRAWTAR